MKKVIVIDYGIGNVRSIQNALGNIGVETLLTRKIDEIISADAVILPGVGAFNHGMSNLKQFGLISALKEYVNTGKPFLGICLGMQMLFEGSVEFDSSEEGLGFIKGEVIIFPKYNIRLPHIGWNEIHEPVSGRWKGTLLDHELINEGTDVYFVHTFVGNPTDKSVILSLTEYEGVKFCSSVHQDNIYGTQFHPEKSANLGAEILKKFVELIK